MYSNFKQKTIMINHQKIITNQKINIITTIYNTMYITITYTESIVICILISFTFVLSVYFATPCNSDRNNVQISIKRSYNVFVRY